MNRASILNLWSVALATMLLSLVGCWCEVPVRLMSWGEMYVTKEGARAGQDRNDLFTGLDWMASTNSPVIAVRMPDGKFLRTDKIQSESFAPYVASGSASVGGGWDVTVNYSHGRMLVSFGEDGNLNRIQLWHHGRGDGAPKASPAFRPADSEEILTFPVSEKDLKEVFGEPTKDETVMHNT